jgi:Na+/H+ antiporter NhaD/arsenite permease-like protein
MSETDPSLVQFSSRKFLIACAVVAAISFGIGRWHSFPSWVVAGEVGATILSLFVFGSIKYRIDKNALTYGAVMVIVGTAWQTWWGPSALHAALSRGEFSSLLSFLHRNLLTLGGLDDLIHLDTMLFILGLTFFVACIAQTRLLESVSFSVLNRFKGRVVPTVLVLTILVSFASGILDGVSMIGLLIRTIVILLVLAGAAPSAVVFSVMVSTLITTVCGMWLAYGEPPNLIMKANLQPLLNDAFFLRYCLPAAVGSWIVVGWNVARRLKGASVSLKKLDLLDRHVADVRFLQAARHGEVFTPLEFVEIRKESLGIHFDGVVHRLRRGVPLGEAMVNDHVPREKRVAFLGEYTAEDLAGTLDDYYVHVFGRNDHKADESAVLLDQALAARRRERISAQRTASLAFVPFVGLLAAHAVNRRIPLFAASFAGFAGTFLAVRPYIKMRRLALKEAAQEYAEYLFLFPLFLSITLLQKIGFFAEAENFLRLGIERLGAASMALAQFWFCTVLSALLDNNVVADFTSRALRGLEVSLLHLFAMAQIAGYALGGCWTHIGSAQSVVAYAYIRKEVDGHFTPFAWIKEMTVVILEISAVIMAIIIVEGFFVR